MIVRPARLLARSFVALLAPGLCRLCESPLLQVVDYPVCEACLDRLRDRPLLHTCDLCSEPLAPETVRRQHADEVLCPACVAVRPRFVRATAFGLYDASRPAIRLLKFEGVPSLARPLGAMLAEAILLLKGDAPASLAVIPVPLFRGKRPYNQSTLLATHALRAVRRAAPMWELSLRPQLLRRTRPTESQFLLSQAQRRENLHGAFHAAKSVTGLDILLIDDVYTTGATANECARVLLAAGAASVRVATLARAGRDVAVQWNPAVLRNPAVQWNQPWPAAAAPRTASKETAPMFP